MIETTHIRIDQAAAMLNSDADTLLIASVEGRIPAYWLLNSRVFAVYGKYEERDDETTVFVRHNTAGYCHFMFIPLTSADLADLLKWPETELYPDLLSKSDSSGGYWRSLDDYVDLDDKVLQATREDIFFERVDIEAIKAAHATPAPGTIKDLPRPPMPPRDNSIKTTMAALMASWPGGPGAIPSGKDLERAAQSIGLSVSDDTIRKVLKAVQEAAPTLPMPK